MQLRGALRQKAVGHVQVSDGEWPLVEAARGGDPKAFRALVDRHQGLVCSIALGLTGSIAQSEEVAQETFIAAWRGLGGLRDPGSFRSWLVGIAQNLSRKSQRKQQVIERFFDRKRDQPHPDLASDDPSPLDRAIHREEIRFVERALSRVPLIYREVLVLFYQGQKSIGNVAELLALSEETVRQRLSRGRLMLQGQVLEQLEIILKRALPPPSFSATVMAAIALAATAPASAATGSRSFSKLYGTRAAILGGVTVAALSVLSVGLHRSRVPAPAHATFLKERVPVGRRADLVPALTAPWLAAPAAAGASEDPLRAAEIPRKAVVSVDLEDGKRPHDLHWGEVVTSCPPRPGNTHCLVSELSLQLEKPYLGINFEARSLFRYARGQVLSFDYWFDDGAARLYIQIGDVDQDSAQLYVSIDNPVRGTWAHVEIPLDQATGRGKDSGKVLAEGDTIGDIFIVRSTDPTRLVRPFYVDNLEVVERGR